MSAEAFEARARHGSGGILNRRRRVAAAFGLLLFLGVVAAALLLIGLRNGPQPMVSVLRATREIRAGTKITGDELGVTSVFAQDPSLLTTLVRETERDRLVGQTAVVDVAAGALIPAELAVPQTSAGMWEASVPVKRMPGDLKAGDHVAILVEATTEAGRGIDLVVMQDVRVLRVGSNAVDLWLPYKAAPQIEWYSDHGGLVLLKTQPGVVQGDVNAGGGP